MTLKHFPRVYYMIIFHVGPPWGHSGTHWGPKMAQNSTKNGIEWLKITRMAQHGTASSNGQYGMTMRFSCGPLLALRSNSTSCQTMEKQQQQLQDRQRALLVQSL